MKNSLHLLFYPKHPDNRLCIFVPSFHAFFKIKISYIEG
jgi:hypothetical protein